MKSSHNNIFCLEITDLYNTILPLTWNLCTWEKTQKVHKRSFGWDSWVCNKHSWWRGSVNIWPLRFVHEWPPTTLSGMCLHICIDSSHWANLIGLSLSATCSAFIPWVYIPGSLWVSHWFLLWLFSVSFSLHSSFGLLSDFHVMLVGFLRSPSPWHLVTVLASASADFSNTAL